MKNALTLLSIVMMLTAMNTIGAEEKTVKIAVVGDSTVSTYAEESDTRGWGQYLQPFFKEGIEVINMAKPGRSTKTFIKEGLWEKTLAHKPQFILIQMGHNDSHAKDKPEATDAATEYADNLPKYIDEARNAGATPVLVTPMHRRKFDAQGKMSTELQPYVDAMKKSGG